MSIISINSKSYCVLDMNTTQSTIEPWCIICGSVLESWDLRCPNMFSTSMQFVGNRISYSLSLSDALMKSFKPNELPSLKICCNCCYKLEEICRIEAVLKAIRHEISTKFDNTTKRWNRGVAFTNSHDPPNVIEKSNLGIRIVETKSIATCSSSTKAIIPAAISFKPKLVMTNPSLGMTIKLVQGSVPAAGKSPVNIRIKNPSSINSSVPETSTPLKKLVVTNRKILPKTPTANVLRTFPPLTKEGTTYSKDAHPSQTTFVPRILVKKSNSLKLGKFSSQIKTSTRVQLTQPETERESLTDDIDSSRTESIPTDFEDFDEDIKPDHSQLLKIKEEPGAHNLISKRKRIQEIASQSESDSKNCTSLISSTGAKWSRIENDGSNDSLNCSSQQKRSADGLDDLPLTISPQQKKLKYSPCKESSAIDVPKRKKRRSNGGFKKRRPIKQSNCTTSKSAAEPKKKTERPKRTSHCSNPLAPVGRSSRTDAPSRRGAFKQASERLQIIANSKHQRSPTSVLKTGQEPDVAGPAKNKLNLKECQIVLMDVMGTAKKNQLISNASCAATQNNFVSRVDELAVKSDFDFVCNGIQKVVLESPPINTNRRCSRSMFMCMDDTSCDVFVCDICKLDFLKLDDLRNHIEQDHFAPAY